MRYLKTFEEKEFTPWDISDLSRDLFGLTEKIDLGSDFYIEGPVETRKFIEEYIPKMKNIISNEEPRYTYYYQNPSAVSIVYRQTQKLQEFDSYLEKAGWRLFPCVLGFFGNDVLPLKPGHTYFFVGNKTISLPTEGKTREEIQQEAKSIAKENGVTHIGRVGGRIPIEKWDGSPY